MKRYVHTHPVKAQPLHTQAIDLSRITRREIFLSSRPQSHVGGNAALAVACRVRECAYLEKLFLAAENAPENQQSGLQPPPIPLLRPRITLLPLFSYFSL